MAPRLRGRSQHSRNGRHAKSRSEANGDKVDESSKNGDGPNEVPKEKAKVRKTLRQLMSRPRRYNASYGRTYKNCVAMREVSSMNSNIQPEPVERLRVPYHCDRTVIYECFLCDRTFSSLEQTRLHDHGVIDGSVYCIPCFPADLFTFKTNQDYCNHWIFHHKNSSVKPRPGEIYRKSYQEMISSDDESSDEDDFVHWRCLICDLSLKTSIRYIRRHLRKCVNYKIYKCTACQEVFFYKREIVRHINVYHEEKEDYHVECNVSVENWLTRYIELMVKKRMFLDSKAHCEESLFEEQKYKCSLCINERFHPSIRKCARKYYFTISELKCHYFNHFFYRPYKCSICCEEFASETQLREHIGDRHEGQRSDQSYHTPLSAIEKVVDCLIRESKHRSLADREMVSDSKRKLREIERARKRKARKLLRPKIRNMSLLSQFEPRYEQNIIVNMARIDTTSRPLTEEMDAEDLSQAYSVELTPMTPEKINQVGDPTNFEEFFDDDAIEEGVDDDYASYTEPDDPCQPSERGVHLVFVPSIGQPITMPCTQEQFYQMQPTVRLKRLKSSECSDSNQSSTRAVSKARKKAVATVKKSTLDWTLRLDSNSTRRPVNRSAGPRSRTAKTTSRPANSKNTTTPSVRKSGPLSRTMTPGLPKTAHSNPFDLAKAQSSKVQASNLEIAKAISSASPPPVAQSQDIIELSSDDESSQSSISAKSQLENHHPNKIKQIVTAPKEAISDDQSGKTSRKVDSFSTVGIHYTPIDTILNIKQKHKLGDSSLKRKN